MANTKAMKYCNSDLVDGDCSCLDSDNDGYCDCTDNDNDGLCDDASSDVSGKMNLLNKQKLKL